MSFWLSSVWLRKTKNKLWSKKYNWNYIVKQFVSNSELTIFHQCLFCTLSHQTTRTKITMKFKDQFKIHYETTESLFVCHLKPISGNNFCSNYMSKLNLYTRNIPQIISAQCSVKAGKIISGVKYFFFHEKPLLVNYICLKKLFTEF